VLGAGAAGIASVHLLRQAGLSAATLSVCDSRGPFHVDRSDIRDHSDQWPEKWALCQQTNPDGTDRVADALRGADVCIAFSRPGPGVVRPEWVESMAKDAIVFACANPTPEIWPQDALTAGARVVATGRCDLPNQLNNSLAFPGIFRGVLDVRARAISDGMALAAADAIAELGRERGLAPDAILPRMEDPDLVPRVAAATGLAAVEEGLAAVAQTREQLLTRAKQMVAAARAASECWSARL